MKMAGRRNRGDGGARSFLDRLRPPFVGASEFLTPVRNLEDARLVEPPRQQHSAPQAAWNAAAPMKSLWGA